MISVRRARLYRLLGLLSILFVALSLIVYSLRQNLNAYVTPSMLVHSDANRTYRLGGMVKVGSVSRFHDQTKLRFVMTDLKKDIVVTYQGALPDLFKEGKGAIVEGSLQKDGVFAASMVLAKHDENYMPKTKGVA